MIAVLDYGSGNLRSVYKALVKVGADAKLAQTPDDMKDARAVVLPGVGAFDDCINAMRKQELLEAVKLSIEQGTPFLGICVGYQALFESSEEYNSCAVGMGVFKGKVKQFDKACGLKIPQIGWNQVDQARENCPLFAGIDDGSYFYFVHSFFPQPEDDSIIASRTDYGGSFSSSVWKDNVFATQFHPEKSQGVGLKLLENFVKLAG